MVIAIFYSVYAKIFNKYSFQYIKIKIIYQIEVKIYV